MSTCSPVASFRAISSIVMTSCVSHDHFEREPCWLSHNMECSSRWSITWLCIICSISLHVIEVREIGRQFAARCLSPFLKTGTIDATRQSLGVVPLLSESWNMHRSIGDNSSAKSWRTLAGISWGPVALCTLMFQRIL